jgi:hypothetical protein
MNDIPDIQLKSLAGGQAAIDDIEHVTRTLLSHVDSYPTPAFDLGKVCYTLPHDLNYVFSQLADYTATRLMKIVWPVAQAKARKEEHGRILKVLSDDRI